MKWYKVVWGCEDCGGGGTHWTHRPHTNDRECDDCGGVVKVKVAAKTV